MGNTEKDSIENESTEKNNAEAKNKTETAGQFSADVKLKECKYCRVLIPKSAKICPNCKMHLKNKWPWRLLALFILAALCAAGIYYRTYLWNFAESVAAMRYTDTAAAGQKPDTDADVQAADAEAQAADARTEATDADAQATDADAQAEATDAEVQAADTQAEATDVEVQAADAQVQAAQAQAADTEGMEKISTVIDSLEAMQPEKKKDILADAGSTDADTDRAEADTEATEGMDEARAEKDEDMKAAGRNKEDGISETETEETAITREIDIQDYTEAEFRDICEQTDYKSLLRKQDIYLNSAVKQEVTVIEQVNGGLFDDSIYYLCTAEDKKGITRYYIVRDDRAEDTMPILEGDVLMIYGQLFDSCKLPADMVSSQPVVPALTMIYYELLDE